MNPIKVFLIALFGMMFLNANAQSKFNKKSELFTLKANGKYQFVEHFKNYHYADFESEGKIKIEINCTENIDKCIVSPIVKGISADIKGKTATFTLSSSGHYIVEINDKEQLIILADEKEKNVPKLSDKKNVVDVTTFVKPDDELIQTEALQKAILEAANTKKILFFSAGVYRTGTLTIPSDSKIYLSRGALIKGSENRADYPTDGNRLEADHVNRKKEDISDNGEFMTFSRLILIEGENIRIWGRGTLDGSGTVVRAQGKPANLIRVRRSKNVLVEGIIQRDPAAWNTHILYSENIIFRDVKVLNDFTVANTDGFDPDASKNVLVDGCFAYCNDDNIAVKTTNNMDLLQNIEEITVRNCVFYTRKSSLKVGTETKGAVMKNILFENNDVVGCDRGLALYCNDGALFENIRWVNNRIEKNVRDSQRRAIMFKINNRYGKGNIRNLLIKDGTFYEDFPNPSSIEGLDGQHTIEGIVFDNVINCGKKVTSLQDFGIRKTPFVKYVRFK